MQQPIFPTDTLTRSYHRSAELLERSKQVLAGGVSSEFRKYNHPHALFYSHGRGSRLYDVDGNEYLDFTLSQGPLIVGHSHPRVLERVREYSERGQLFAGQHMLEVELAEKLHHHIPSAELMRFCLDGSSAVHTALRLARAKTGKQKFLRFEGHYHGWLDNVAWGLSAPNPDALGSRAHPHPYPWTQGLPAGARDEFMILPWNDPALLEETVVRHHADLAAIITEPVMCNNGCIPPEPGYLATMRALCDRYDITLIFDEVITGFRTSLGGAQQLYGVTPDLAIFAKAMASGYPISAVVGKRPWTNLLADGTVIHAGTMNAGNPSVAAALATIEVLEAPGTHERIFRLGHQLMNGLTQLGQELGHNLLVQGVGPMFQTCFTALPCLKDYRDTLSCDKAKLKTFIAGLQDHGVRAIGRGLWYISAVHTEEDIEQVLDTARAVLSDMKK
ncbi:MAG: aminotransferase class III-fold pyridoxal phosphate-dependent enzyme [Tunicatimonas sp.]